MTGTRNFVHGHMQADFLLRAFRFFYECLIAEMDKV